MGTWVLSSYSVNSQNVPVFLEFIEKKMENQVKIGYGKSIG